MALQALFEADKTKHSAISVLDRMITELEILEDASSYLQRISEMRLVDALEKQIKNVRLAEPYARELIEGVGIDLHKVDQKIREFAPEFPVQQLSGIDRNILRVAIWEGMFHKGTPPKVIINEAVEIAKAFGTEASAKFINGVLGALLVETHVSLSPSGEGE